MGKALMYHQIKSLSVLLPTLIVAVTSWCTIKYYIVDEMVFDFFFIMWAITFIASCMIYDLGDKYYDKGTLSKLGYKRFYM